jgi:hypothetical protein
MRLPALGFTTPEDGYAVWEHGGTTYRTAITA